MVSAALYSTPTSPVREVSGSRSGLGSSMPPKKVALRAKSARFGARKPWATEEVKRQFWSRSVPAARLAVMASKLPEPPTSLGSAGTGGSKGENEKSE